MNLSTLTIGGGVLGTFSKGCRGSVALNYAPSGGENCETSCAYHPATTSPHAVPNGPRCYAVLTEKRYTTTLAPKLSRHQAAGADAVTAQADKELAAMGYRVPWFRVSSFGSVPATPPAGFRALLAKIVKANGPGVIHLPIESPQKANRYRRTLQGLGIAVRESVTNIRRWRMAPHACSIVAGTMADTPRERVEIAKALAKDRTARTGRRCVICPAVAAKHLRTGSKLAKCGGSGCRACSASLVDIVYPAH